MKSTAADPPYVLSVEQVAAQVGTDPERGLTSAEARRRLNEDGPNSLTVSEHTGWLARFGRQFGEPLVLLLFAALAISLGTWFFEDESGWPIDAIVIAVILITNAALGAFQEHRADQAVQALAEMTAGQVSVVRDNHQIRVPITDVVVGDVLVVSEGDLIAADARVTSSQSLMVAEAALTGESLPVVKQVDPVSGTPGIGDRSCMVHAGTAAVVGHGQALVTATAMQTEVGLIADMLSTTAQVPTPLEREIHQVSRFLGAAVIAIAIVIAGVIVTSSSIDSASDLVDVLIIAVSVAVAAVPEGLPAVLSIVLAIGVSRMAKQNALVKRLASAETLGAATIICTDKTGTLTRNQMEVRTAVVGTGDFDVPTLAAEAPAEHPVRDGLIAAAAASNVEFKGLLAGDDATTLLGDPTETSLVRAAFELGTIERLASVERLGELPFDSDRKRMSVLVRGLNPQDKQALTVITKGAPDVLLERCSSELGRYGAVALTEERRGQWRSEIMSLADQAMRTILVAVRPVEPNFELSPAAESDLTLIALFGLLDPPRSEVAEAIATAQNAGIRVVMLTGDHPNTAASIATSLAISSEGETVITGSELDAADQTELAALLDTNSVFARVAPAHKLRMVQALQEAGHVVAMTGDGVNDAPALKAADIGTAMGRSGTDVAREAADMVLTDDNFATIVEAVRVGRTIFINVKSFLRYLLSSNVGEVLTIFLGVVFAGAIGLRGDGSEVIAPLTAVQILWINLVTDSGPAFALGVDPAARNVMNHRPRRPGDRVIDAAMQRGIGVVGLTMALATLVTFDAKRPGGLIEGSSDIATAQTAAFTVLVLAQLFNCFSARSDRDTALRGTFSNPYLLAAVGVSLLLQIAVVYVPALQEGFGTTSLSLTDWLIATLVASSVLVSAEVRKAIERRFAPEQ